MNKLKAILELAKIIKQEKKGALRLLEQLARALAQATNPLKAA